ncbi:PhnD/SsuA/transferrin family substrate-binding protein [Thiobacter aerophilum]|uniref:PhnD/SsuA/transferrin family substrate-binding protein n=1 Tax=Thiobacter aerophilum TaxID=3121275 RepID=A0ABV0EAU7_9BURK
MWGWLALFPLPATADPAPLRIGTTAVFLDDQIGFLRQWGAYLERRLQRPVRFVQRTSYREIVDLLMKDDIEFAWICGYPYVRGEPALKLVAVPLFEGKPLYRSYVIVPSTDTRTRTLLDLRGKIFAFSDPLSNSGWLVPEARLREQGLDPGRFFARTFFTWAHRRVVEAVAAGLADGGAIDGYVYDTLAKLHPELTRQTRIAERSPKFGFPPVVAAPGASAADITALRAALLGMATDPDGRSLLTHLNLTGFTAGSPALFDGIRRNRALVEARP